MAETSQRRAKAARKPADEPAGTESADGPETPGAEGEQPELAADAPSPEAQGGSEGEQEENSEEQRSEPRQAPRYPVAELKEMARDKFGCSPHVVAGALAVADTETFSEEEARERITSFASAAAIDYGEADAA